MRSVYLIAVSVFLIVVAGAVSISWFAQAAASKQAIEQAIARLNATEKMVSYERIETFGFPAHVYVAIVNPQFTGRIDTLLKQHPAFASMPQWHEDVKVNGNLVYGINAFSNHYTMSVQGTIEEKAVIGDKSFSTLYESAGNPDCALKLAHSGGIFGTLWDFGEIAREGRDVLQDFRMLDCSLPSGSAMDPASRAVLNTSGPIRFYVTQEPQGDRLKLRVFAKLADMEVLPAGDAVMAATLQALSPEQASPINYSAYGKQNIALDFSYDGPRSLEKAKEDQTMDVALHNFDVTNNIYQQHANFFLTNATHGDVRKTRLAFKADFNADKQYKALWEKILLDQIRQLFARPDEAAKIAGRTNPVDACIEEAKKKYTPEQFYTLVQPVIPDFFSLGKMVHSLDISYVGTPDISSGEVTLSNLELSAAPYGITGSGTAKKTAGAMMPAVNASLECRNCQPMVDAVADYSQRVQMLVDSCSAGVPAQFAISAQEAQGVKGFLTALAQPQDKDIFHYTIGSDTGGMVINGKNAGELVALYSQYVLLPPAQPH